MSYVTCEKTMSDAVSRANSDFLAAANEIAAHTLATTIRTPKRLTGGAKSVGNVAVDDFVHKCGDVLLGIFCY